MSVLLFLRCMLSCWHVALAWKGCHMVEIFQGVSKAAIPHSELDPYTTLQDYSKTFWCLTPTCAHPFQAITWSISPNHPMSACKHGTHRWVMGKHPDPPQALNPNPQPTMPCCLAIVLPLRTDPPPIFISHLWYDWPASISLFSSASRHQENPYFTFCAFLCFFMLFHAFYKNFRKSTKKPSHLLARVLSEPVKKVNRLPQAL